jgi:hypothetical protein
MKIFGYYQSIGTGDQPEEFACANLWKTSWTHFGWEPVMLNRSHAQVSLKYNKMLQKLVGDLRHSEDLRPRFDWIVARFIRWCALHASGGGWMSDYDVLNTGFTTESAKKHTGTLSISAGPAYLFYVTPEHALNVINKFLSEDITNGKLVYNECDILNTQPSSFEGVLHIKTSDGKKRSQLMQEQLNLLFSEDET